MPCGHKKGPGATDLLPNTQAIRLASQDRAENAPARTRRTANQAERQKICRRTSAAKPCAFKRLPRIRISAAAYITPPIKSQSPTLDAVRVDFFDHFLRSSFERYRIGFSAHAALLRPALRRVRPSAITFEKAHKSTVGSRMTTARNGIARGEIFSII